MKSSMSLEERGFEELPCPEQGRPGVAQGEELPPQERDILQQCEEQIEAGLHSFIVVGNALYTIKEQRLYRAEFKSFEDYCQTKWGIGRQYAYRLIAAGQVVRKMTPVNENIPLPA